MLILNILICAESKCGNIGHSGPQDKDQTKAGSQRCLKARGGKSHDKGYCTKIFTVKGILSILVTLPEVMNDMGVGCFLLHVLSLAPSKERKFCTMFMHF